METRGKRAVAVMYALQDHWLLLLLLLLLYYKRSLDRAGNAAFIIVYIPFKTSACMEEAHVFENEISCQQFYKNFCRHT